MASISRFLEKVLKVKVNRDKSKVVNAEESSFLGFTFTRKRLTVSEKSLMRFKSELRRLSGRSWGVSMDYRYWKTRTYLQGWMNYFGIALKYNDAVEVDHWLRRRIRMCYWKQWRRARKRIGELIKHGAPRYHAILTGLSRKGYWHLSKTFSTNLPAGRQVAAWVTSFFKSRGLLPYVHCGLGFTIRLRPDNFCEPPIADPHDVAVWGLGVNYPRLPDSRPAWA
jgi:hypothetical protein